ncbi:MAG: PolC-type DNA polymerase III [Clostridia bacterium]
MKKVVKDVFFNCLDQSSKFCDACVEEVKFSKKLNAVIIKTTSDNDISLFELEEFEKRACKAYDLKSFKIDYEYTGKKRELDVVDIQNIIANVNKKYVYAQDIFENCKIDIEKSQMQINIVLIKPYAGFLNIKKIDVYIAKCLQVEYGLKYSICITEEKSAKASVGDGLTRVKLENIPISKRAQNSVENVQSSDKKNANVNKSSSAQGGNKENYFKRPPMSEEEKEDARKIGSPQPENVLYGVNISTTERIKVQDVTTNQDRVCISGCIFQIDARELKSGKMLVSLDVTDYTSTITCKMFLDKKRYSDVKPKLNKGEYIDLQGRPQFDTYSKEITIMIQNIIKGEKVEAKKDNANEKRVELHMHTQMSAMDAITPVSTIVNQAIKWGHKAVAITDHGVVQSFPEAHGTIMKAFSSLVKKEKGYPTTQEVLDVAPTKVIYGVEGYLTQDIEPESTKSDTFCVFDLETTGFNPKYDKITEVAVAKVRDGKIVDEFTTFVNPERPIPLPVQQLTHITEDMVKNAPTVDKMLPKFLEFTKGSILVAHNSKFDMSFIKHYADEEKLEVCNGVIDTLTIARELYPNFENHKLGTIAQELGVSLEGAHRAINDVRATVEIFLQMSKDAQKKNVEIYDYMYTNLEEEAKKLPYYHIIILAKNYEGLKNLYKLISYSHLRYFNKRPRIPRSLLNRYKEGLIIGSACERGELYQSIYNKESPEKIEKIANFYDYLEVQPLGNNQFYLDKGMLSSKEELININKEIINLGEKLNKTVVATCDTHFLNPEDEIYRRILMAGQGYDDADKQAPLYYRTTEEMLEEFDYLTPEKAYELVVTNTNKVADWCDRISPISDEKCPPHIDGCEKEIENIAMTKAKELYGDSLPDIVQKRLEKELESIIKNGFSVMYIIAQKLVWKSNEDGYLVGSRGSVGSSFVANMTGITEVNSLQPHYRCKKCKYSDFSDFGVKNGFDLPDKKCPKCGEALVKDGMDIPFETFLGFNGDKEPDIDLNFSGEYQAKAHKYTEVIFGKGTTYKAGTIGTIADKTAYGFVMKYFESKQKTLPAAEINRLSKGCTGIKRTSGQHPGGIIVVPKGREIYEFCPVQHPADDPRSSIITTHFDYHSIDKNLLKLDILGHDDPTMIRMLQDITGVEPISIPLDDKETMSIFSCTDALGVTAEQINSEVGTFGVPEFGTKFVRGMLVDTRPTTFEELLRISGLSHGTDVWLNNAQTLIQEGTITLSEAICTRDDIMTYLIKKGLPPNPSFKIMECVRKGKGLTEEQEGLMREYSVPDWYIGSCKKIKYMFPKAHAAAYVTMAFRIAWFKVHIPIAYYASFFSIRADEFESESMIHGKEKVKLRMKELDMQGNTISQKDKNMYPILELVLEMYERGIKFLPVDIYISDSKKFLVEKEGIRPPLSSLSGFGEVDAEKLVEARKKGKFTSIEQMSIASKLGKVAVETLRVEGCLAGMPRSEQMDMFDLLG